MVKIAIIHADHYEDRQGGGELTTKYWYEQGLKEGLDITWIHNKSTCRDDFDYYLIGNFPEFADKGWLMKIIATKPHAFLVHNSINWNGAWREWYSRAQFAVTLAPDHAHKIELPIKQVYVTSSYIDHTRFRELGMKRKEASLYVGHIHPIKINKLMIEHMRATDRQYDIYGDGEPFFALPNVTFKGAIDNSLTPLLMNEYKTFFWHLDRYGCYGRTIVEALLCGMELDVNQDNFGLFKFDWIHKGRQSIIEALEEDRASFWTDILKLMS